MALVYLARQTDLDRFVALKELGAFHASDASFAQRFLRESRVAGSLSHPNIVTVHDYFEHEGTPYIAMEYVERGSLRPYVGKMTISQIGGVLEGLLAGLTNAEQNGIVHRDLKPENLMVTSDGRVKIADFGIAKATTKMQTGAFLTATGTTVGTPTYMAPEQAMAQDIGPWTDLYSVGCMAFEMFTGKVPFHDSDAPMAILLRHVNEPIAPVKSINPEVDQRISDWVEAMLVKDPTQRTQSAADAWDDFEEIIIGLLGPRWRRKARLGGESGAAEGPNPLTPGAVPGHDRGCRRLGRVPELRVGPARRRHRRLRRVHAVHAAAAGPAVGPDGGDAGARGAARRRRAAGRGRRGRSRQRARRRRTGGARTRGARAAAPSDEPIADSGFVTFGQPAPAPPTDALVPPPADAPPADAPAEPAAPEPAEPEPEVAAPEPEPEPEPEPQAEAITEEPAADAGFETYIAPPPPRPPRRTPARMRCRASRRRPSRPLPSRLRPSPSPPSPSPSPPRPRRRRRPSRRRSRCPSLRASRSPSPRRRRRRRRRCGRRVELRVRPERDGHAGGAAPEARAEGQAQEGAQAEGAEGPEGPEDRRPPSPSPSRRPSPSARARSPRARRSRSPSASAPSSRSRSASCSAAPAAAGAAPSRPPTPAR